MLSQSHHLARTRTAVVAARDIARPGRGCRLARTCAAAVAAAALLASACSAEEPPAPTAEETATTTTAAAAPADTAAPAGTAAPAAPSPCNDPAAEDLGGGLVELDGVVFEVFADACVPRFEEPAGDDDAAPVQDTAEAQPEQVCTDDVCVDMPAAAPTAAPAACPALEHRHTPEGGCHWDADILESPPSACEDDPSDGVCSVGDAQYRLTEQNIWLHEHLNEPDATVPAGQDDATVTVTVPEVQDDDATVPVVSDDATCADVASRDGAMSSEESRHFDRPLTAGVWRYELCVPDGDPDKPDAWIQMYPNLNGTDEGLPYVAHPPPDPGGGAAHGYFYADSVGPLWWVAEVAVVKAEDYDQNSRNEAWFPVNDDGTLGVYPEGTYEVKVRFGGYEGYVFHLSRIGDVAAEGG